MKYLFLLVLSASLSGCMTQLIPNEIENGKLMGVMPMKYDKAMYQVSNRTKASREDIFRQTRRWAAFHLPSAATALSVSDNMLGDVMISRILDHQIYKIKGGYVNLPRITYAISIESMDGFYRASASNFIFEPTALLKYPAEKRVKGTSKKVIRQHLQEINKDVEALLSELETFVPGEILKERQQ